MADTPVLTPNNPQIAEPKNATAEAPNPQMEAFARKEKQLRNMQIKMQQEKQALESKLKQYETDYIPRSKFKEDPMSVLNDAGISYEQLSEMVLNAPNMNDPTTRALMNKIKALEDKQNQTVRQQEESTKAQYQQAVKQIGNEIKMLVDSDAEYSTVKEAGMQDAVLELIEQTFQNEGYLMEVHEAAKQVENHLVEQALKLANIEKVKSKLNSQLQKPVEPVQNKAGTQPQIKTLTQNMPSQPAKRLSEKERKERALAAFYGKLNQ